MNVLIRKAKSHELKAIQDLNHQLFLSDSQSDPLLNIDWPYQPEGIDYFERMIAGVNGVCFVAEVDEQIIGYLAGCLRKNHNAWQVRRTEVENMIVASEYRSQGIGSRLIEAFFEWSKQQDVTHVLVGAFAANERAIEFYKRQGFKPYELFLEAQLD